MSEQQTYRVSWVIDVVASSPKDAAREALTMLRDPQSIVTVFQVEDEHGGCVTVDLSLEHRRELGTILAALRSWQRRGRRDREPMIMSILTDDDSFAPLDPEEIDELCQRLNC